MKHIPNNTYSPVGNRHAQSAGFTLIELMIAIALGLVLLISMTQIFASMKSSYRFQEAMARVQENGRIANDIIAHQSRLAGFRTNVWDDPVQNFYPVTGGSTDGGAGANDTLQVMYMDDVDCLNVTNGAGIDAETNQRINFFKRVTFAVDANDNLTWTCEYAATVATLAVEISAEVVVTGVDSFQILYGVDTDLPLDFSLNRWSAASAITPQTSICVQSQYICETDPASLLANMANGVPVSIQVGLLLRSPERVASTDNVAYVVLDENVAAAGDNLYRQLFVTTVNLRNLTL